MSRIINNILKKNNHNIIHYLSINKFEPYTNYKIIIKNYNISEKIYLKIKDDTNTIIEKNYDSNYIIDYFFTSDNTNINIMTNGQYIIKINEEFKILHHLILLSNYFDNIKELYNQSNIIPNYHNNIIIQGNYTHYSINNYRKLNNIGMKLEGKILIDGLSDGYKLFYFIGQNGYIRTKNKLTYSNHILTSIIDESNSYSLITDTICNIQKLCYVSINDLTIEHNYKFALHDIIVIIAFTGRYEIMKKNIMLLKNQSKKCGIILVGSTDEDIEFCKSQDVYYIRCNNKPLGLKWQVGVYYARLFNPESIIILGSDDLLSKNYIKIAYNNIKLGYDMIGIRSWYINNDGDIYYIKYTDKINITLGGGRIYSRRILDKINWELFELFIDKGLDDYGYHNVKNNGGKYLDNLEGAYLTSIKGDWEMINSFDKMKQYEKLGYIEIKNIN
jgi:hypothetical protein